MACGKTFRMLLQHQARVFFLEETVQNVKGLLMAKQRGITYQEGSLVLTGFLSPGWLQSLAFVSLLC